MDVIVGRRFFPQEILKSKTVKVIRDKKNIINIKKVIILLGIFILLNNYLKLILAIVTFYATVKYNLIILKE